MISNCFGLMGLASNSTYVNCGAPVWPRHVAMLLGSLQSFSFMSIFFCFLVAGRL